MAQEFADWEIQVDGLEEVAAWGGEDRPLAPTGDYPLLVISAEQKPSSNNNQMIVVEFEVADDFMYTNADGAESNAKGMKIWNNYVLTPAAMGRIKALMVACGASLDAIRARELIGQTILATVVHNQGKAKINEQGEPLPVKMFANVTNERPLAQPEPVAAKTPPIAAGKAATGKSAPAGNSAARRA